MIFFTLVAKEVHQQFQLITENMAAITLYRNNDTMNLLRNYRIYIDGELAGRIANGESVGYDLAPGEHTLTAKIDWCCSRDIHFEIKTDEHLSFNVSGLNHSNKIIGAAVLLVATYLLLLKTAGPAYALIPVSIIIAMLLYRLSFGRKHYLRLSELQQ